MRYASALFLLLGVVGLVGAIGSRWVDTSKAATPYKVMVMGDSIVDGLGYAGAFRVSLWERLVTQEGFFFDFVGSLSNGPASLGDKHHEGHSGWRIRDLRSQVDTWMNNSKPDIVLLLIGSNDAEQNDDMANAPARLQDLIQRMCTVKPGIQVVVSTATPENGEPVDIPVFNSKIPAVVSALNANGCKTTMVDAFSLMSLSDLADGVHPNWTGHTKIANAFYPPLKAFLQGTPTPPPPPPTPVISQTNNLLNGKIFVSSAADSTSEPGNPATNVNDRNETSRWISVPADNTTLTTDLGANYTLNKVSVLWAGNTVKSYELQISANNTTWTTVASGATNNTTPQLIDTTSFTATPTGRYFRILAKDRWNAGYGNSIWEVGAYGTAAAADAPGDANGDGRINALDLSTVITRDGQNYPAADFNKDGTVGAADLAILLGKWTW